MFSLFHLLLLLVCVCVCVQVSGLSLWVAELLTPLGNLPVLATITVACIIVTTVTEVASNAATITIFLPILSALVGLHLSVVSFCWLLMSRLNGRRADFRRLSC